MRKHSYFSLCGILSFLSAECVCILPRNCITNWNLKLLSESLFNFYTVCPPDRRQMCFRPNQTEGHTLFCDNPCDALLSYVQRLKSALQIILPSNFQQWPSMFNTNTVVYTIPGFISVLLDEKLKCSHHILSSIIDWVDENRHVKILLYKKWLFLA